MKTIETLNNDPLFAEANVSHLLEIAENKIEEATYKFFKRLSSGHAIILLTVTRLIQHVDEKTIVMIDEPEGHLHPPLLSAFIRALSDLLVSRNGMAIITTHSPVILQEVPKSCVWILRRNGLISKAERPEIETFGENVGILTRSIFGLDVERSGFHKILRDWVDKRDENFESIMNMFDGQLGSEGQMILRTLIALRDRAHD